MLERTPLFQYEIAEKVGLNVATVNTLAHKTAYGGRGWSKFAKFDHNKIIIRRTKKSKLSPEQARNVLREYVKHLCGKPGYRIKDICGRYKISQTLFFKIRRGEIWPVATVAERTLLEHIL